MCAQDAEKNGSTTGSSKQNEMKMCNLLRKRAGWKIEENSYFS
jgi:hypothetical protein